MEIRPFDNTRPVTMQTCYSQAAEKPKAKKDEEDSIDETSSSETWASYCAKPFVKAWEVITSIASWIANTFCCCCCGGKVDLEKERDQVQTLVDLIPKFAEEGADKKVLKAEFKDEYAKLQDTRRLIDTVAVSIATSEDPESLKKAIEKMLKKDEVFDITKDKHYGCVLKYVREHKTYLTKAEKLLKNPESEHLDNHLKFYVERLDAAIKKAESKESEETPKA